MKRERKTIICSVIFIVIAGLLYWSKGNSSSVKENLLMGDETAATEHVASTVCPSFEPAKHKTIYCYICGAVKNPGVYECLEGARLVELIDKAGGFTKQAAGTSMNLARKVEDSEQVYIPTKSEAGKQKDTNQPGSLSEEEDAQTVTEDKVNINTADVDKLTSLPGIGQAKAKSICSYREEHGAFRSIEELKNVEGIKDGVYSKVEDLITIQ